MAETKVTEKHGTDFRTLFDRDYIASFDLQGRDVAVTISKVIGGELTAVGGRKSRKPILYFAGKERGMICNKTNAKTIAALFGNFTEAATSTACACGRLRQQRKAHMMKPSSSIPRTYDSPHPLAGLDDCGEGHMIKTPKMQHCDFCGTEVGVFEREFRERITCGARECERWARDDEAEERRQAHEDLDHDRGWS
jgi:hypothetical protein